MRWLVIIGLTAALGFAGPNSALSSAREAAYPLTPEAAGVVMQSSEEALAQDLTLIADARGWTLEEAQAYYRAEQAIGRIAERVAAEWPEAFVGSALSPEPDGAPTLFVKGPADKLIYDLVDAAGIEIAIADNQPFSFAELEDRKDVVHRALQAQGFRSAVTSVNITGAGIVKASVTRESGLATTADAILAGLPAELKGSVELTISDLPMVVDEGAFGGMWVLDNGFYQCTSGWTVQLMEGNSPRGVSSAAHCTSIDQIEHPGHGLHALTYQNGHEGQWGDVEWYTSTQAEADDFYADATSIRDVSLVERRANIAVNELICAYGRSSNVRHCSLKVKNVSIACGNLNRLVQMNGDTQIVGDSGGGWSVGETAYGGHSGNCDGLDSFTVADLFDEALNVFVPTS